MAEVQIKLSKTQHEMLLGRLGSDDAIKDWMETVINQELQQIATGNKTNYFYNNS